jgi:hemerythrin superfamily protein
VRLGGALHELLTHDHEHLDALLASMIGTGEAIDPRAYAEFRRGLLRHIGIEEKIIFPVVRRAGVDLPLIEQLHRDHALLAALLVPPPTPFEIEAIRAILAAHNPLEEDAGGLYGRIEALAGEELTDLLGRVTAFPEPRLAPHSDNGVLRRTIAQLTLEAEQGRAALKR